jgi:hypothetical protein
VCVTQREGIPVTSFDYAIGAAGTNEQPMTVGAITDRFGRVITTEYGIDYPGFSFVDIASDGVPALGWLKVGATITMTRRTHLTKIGISLQGRMVAELHGSNSSAVGVSDFQVRSAYRNLGTNLVQYGKIQSEFSAQWSPQNSSHEILWPWNVLPGDREIVLDVQARREATLSLNYTVWWTLWPGEGAASIDAAFTCKPYIDYDSCDWQWQEIQGLYKLIPIQFEAYSSRNRR